VEIRIPSEKDFVEDENCDENFTAVKSARTAKRSLKIEKGKTVYSVKEKKNQSEEIFPTQIEKHELEYTENGEIVLPVKAIREFNEEAKRGRLPQNDIEVRTTNLYHDYDQIASWLCAVERENLGHFQRTPRNDRKKKRRLKTEKLKLIAKKILN